MSKRSIDGSRHDIPVYVLLGFWFHEALSIAAVWKLPVMRIEPRSAYSDSSSNVAVEL